MPCRLLLTTLVFSLLASLAVAVEAPATISAITELKGVVPNEAAFKDAGRKKPIKLTSKDDAAKYFDEKQLAALAKQVDFKKQLVLVFAWRGSGGDHLSYDVAESFPEQVTFVLKPGRTFDLRQHTKVYALRSNVKWSVR